MDTPDVTQQTCPDNPFGMAHYFVVRAAGGGRNQHVCRDCGRTEKYLRDALLAEKRQTP